MPRKLSVSIHSDGSITAEASGTPGPDCLDALSQLRQMLNAEIEGSKPTPEFFVASTPIAVEDLNYNYMEDR
ncbi:DUF2997 domain-containing protein [Luteolibacter marinus]|uniref:DUF2997 domain-containing protein n=1 Tax=Luteolibacter marinus TaxID=2776705 RepID=UPI001D031846